MTSFTSNLPLSESPLFAPSYMELEELPVLRVSIIWNHLLMDINLFIMLFFPFGVPVCIAGTMAATWLLAVVLVRIPTTRRICLKDARGITMLCWGFCVLWMTSLYPHFREVMETRPPVSDFLKLFIVNYIFMVAWVLEFMVMLSFWGNLKWKQPIATVGCLMLGTLDQPFRELIPSENNLDLFAYSSLPHEDPDLSHLSDSQLDEKQA